MFKPVQKCLHEQLETAMTDSHPGSQVFDTHHKDLILGLKPDIYQSSRRSARPRWLVAL